MGLDPAGQPVLPRRPALLEPCAALLGERKQDPPPVGRVRSAAHKAGGFEHGHEGPFEERAPLGVEGRTVRALVPDLEIVWLDTFGAVALT